MNSYRFNLEMNYQTVLLNEKFRNREKKIGINNVKILERVTPAGLICLNGLSL